MSRIRFHSIRALFNHKQVNGIYTGPGWDNWVSTISVQTNLDNILKGIIEEKKDLQQLEEDGYKKDLILKIISLIKKAEFKRKQAPPILKLSSQSLGSDWRVPIAISY